MVFNGGSQLALGSYEDATAMSTIFINTQLAACGGCLSAAVVTRLVGGKTDVIMMLTPDELQSEIYKKSY